MSTMPFWRQPVPKVVWKHDGWTLNRIYERVKANPRRAAIVKVLQQLLAGNSVAHIVRTTGERRSNIFRWINTYNTKGLQAMLGVSVPLPIQSRLRICEYIRENPQILSSILKLVDNDDFDLFAEEMGVRGKDIKNWTYELELGGTDARRVAKL